MKITINATFPTAATVRALDTIHLREDKELIKLTEQYVNDQLVNFIIYAQENNNSIIEALQEIMYCEYPEFVKTPDHKNKFIRLLKDSLRPLGYEVVDYTNKALTPAEEFIVSWKLQPPTVRGKDSMNSGRDQ